MEFVTDPPIAVKIQKMKQRVRWQHPLIVSRQIDQTQLVVDAPDVENPAFSFLVIGDSGSGSHRDHSPQRKIAELMLQHGSSSRFIIHTGDVIYLVGSREYYARNFIQPYREFIVGGDRPKAIQFNQMTFRQPFFLVPGNHDYYDLPLHYGLLLQATAPFRYLLRSRLDFDVGLQGSEQGKAYAQAFLDYLLAIDQPHQLSAHLDRHYTATGTQGRCLRYLPQQFTRLPNRYYQFRYGGIDFFALDSNTFNTPLPLTNHPDELLQRRRLEQQRSNLQQQQQELMQQSMQLDPHQPDQAEQLDDCRTKIEQLQEEEKDINKQLSSDQTVAIDTEQLEWLQQRLIESWFTDKVRGRVLFFHHPPYVTESTKWYQGQTLAVRQRLRSVFDQVAKVVGERAQGQAIVDLVLNGHAHCLEYLRTHETGHADSQINWIVCGGSGYSLRRQRAEGVNLFEEINPYRHQAAKPIATSKLFVGRSGQGSSKHRPYSFLRIDVQAGSPPRFVVQPVIADRYQHQWYEQKLPSFEITN